MKKLFTWLMFMAVMFLPVIAIAGEINDVHGGNGIVVKATAANIQVSIFFSKNEPNDTSKDGLVKYSIPYDGTAKSDGYLYATEGQVFEGYIGRKDVGNLVAEAVVGKGGKGPLVYIFPNPTKAGNLEEMAFWSLLKGTKNQFVCPPWEPNRLYFARPNSAHPKGTMHSIAFAIGGDQVSDVVKKAAAKGWKPAYVYWKEKGVMGPPSWELENLMTGKAPQ